MKGPERSGRLLLVRHGESTWNAVGRWAGQADPDLTARGRTQALDLSRELAEIGFDGIVTSDLRRARTTGELIATAIAVGDVRVDPRLRERHSTLWCGLTHDEIEARWPGRLAAWRAGQVRNLPGETESWELFRSRVEQVLVETLRSRLAMVVVAHAGVFRAVEAMLDVPNRQIDNGKGQWLALDRDERPQLGTPL